MYTENRKSGLEDITKFGSFGAFDGEDVSIEPVFRSSFFSGSSNDRTSFT